MMSKQRKVGYGNPPIHSRWQKGQSGNPTGARRAEPSLAELIQDELKRGVKVIENGKEKSITVRRFAIRAQAARAAKGDLKAFLWLIENAKHWADF